MRGLRGESWNRVGLGAAGMAAMTLLMSAATARAQIRPPATCSGSSGVDLDCNGNNTDDYCDINESGFSADLNSNGIPDECDFEACNANLWDGFQPVPPWVVAATVDSIDFNEDGDAWDNPSGSWTTGNTGCPPAGKAIKGAVSDSVVPPGYVTSEFFHTNEAGLLGCTSAKYTIVADFKSEAQLNPKIDWQIVIHSSAARTNLKDPVNDPAVILIHLASTQSTLADVTGAQGGNGRGRVLVQNPAGSPVFINTGHRIIANQCFKVKVELDNNAPDGQAVKLTVGSTQPITIARLDAGAYRMDYFYIQQVANGQNSGGQNRLAMDSIAVCEVGAPLDWLDCNQDCVDDDYNLSLGQSGDCNASLVPDECDNANNCSCDGPAVTNCTCIWCNHTHNWTFENPAGTGCNSPEKFNQGSLDNQRGWRTISVTDTADVQVVPCSSAVPPTYNYCGCPAPLTDPCFAGNIVKLSKLGFGEFGEGVVGPPTRLASAGDADFEFWEVDVVLDAQDQSGQVYFVVWDPCTDSTTASQDSPPTRFDGTDFTAGVQFHTDTGNVSTVRLLDGTAPTTVWRDEGLNRSWGINQKKHIQIKINNTTGQVEYYAGVHKQGFREPLRMYTLANENPLAGGDRQVLLLNTSQATEDPDDPGINAYWDTFKYSRDNNCDRDDLPDSLWLAGGEFAVACYNLNNNGYPDWCEDCDANATLDSTEITAGTAKDCNANGIPDVCDVDPTQPQYREFQFGGIDVPAGACIPGGDPSFWDYYSRRGGGSFDCNSNGTPDECDADCNGNRLADECDIDAGTSKDLGGPSGCAPDSIPDECQADCNTNGIHDRCDIAGGTSLDCNNNLTDDACDLAGNDCNNNKTPDDCELVDNDCNTNGIPDDPCELATHDANTNGVVDECEQGGNLVSAITRKPNTAGPGQFCDLAIDMPLGLPITSDMRVDPGDVSVSRGITHLIFTYDAPPGSTAVTLKQATCAAPSYVDYAGTSVVNCVPAGNLLACTFTPGLENVRTYRLTVPHGTGTADVEIRGLIGDTNSDGRVNAVDRSGVVGIWTTTPGFNCVTDINNDGRTNASDRSLVNGFWTSAATNCAP